MKFSRCTLSVLLAVELAASILPKNAHAQDITPEFVRALFPPFTEASTPQQNESLVKLGKKLFYDTRFSKSQKMSCNTCHNISNYGVDSEPTSPGHEGKRGDRNSPTVLNSGFHFAQFWDGRAKDVEEQALGPVLNPGEMGMASATVVEDVIKGDKGYLKLFSDAFPGETNAITFKNFGKAIGAFERTLVTPSRYDGFANGDSKALTEAEKNGLKKFISTGCTACHMGQLFGGMMYQKLGLVRPYETKDLGRYAVTKKDEDKYVFKVPSLRNVEKTGPYFHDGSVKDLPTAVKLMSAHQLGRDLPAEDVESIVTFLKALTGEISKEAL